MRAGVMFMLGAFAGSCGDPLLPADFAGPPAMALGGSVVRGDDAQQLEAATPRLALVWLTNVEAPLAPAPVLVQPVAFARSQELRKDWDIGISLPAEGAKLRWMGDGGRGLGRLAIGKMVYFDDRDGNGTLNLPCASGTCDLVKAISHEFLVFLDQPLTCQNDGAAGVEAKVRLNSGFHHFEWADAAITETAPGSDLRFLLQQTQSFDEPVNALQGFARQLLRTYRFGALSGC